MTSPRFDGYEIIDLPEVTRAEGLKRARIQSHMRRVRRAPAAPAQPAWREARPVILDPESWDYGTASQRAEPDAEALVTRDVALASSTPEAVNPGARIVGSKDLASAGMWAHRGILHPDEYVDVVRLTSMIEAELGFRMSEINRAFPPGSRGGRPPRDVARLKARIGARFLRVADAGGNTTELGRRLGWTIRRGATGGDYCPRMVRALASARARQARNRGRSHDAERP